MLIMPRRPPAPDGRDSDPQCGQTRCGSLASWHCGHSLRPTGFKASCVRRLAVLVFECRRLGFGTIDLLCLHCARRLARRPREPRSIAPGSLISSCPDPGRAVPSARPSRESSHCGAQPQHRRVEIAAALRTQIPCSLSEQSGFIGSASWNCSRISAVEIEHVVRIVGCRQVVLGDLALPLAEVLFTRHVPKIEGARRPEPRYGSRHRPHSTTRRAATRARDPIDLVALSMHVHDSSYRRRDRVVLGIGRGVNAAGSYVRSTCSVPRPCRPRRVKSNCIDTGTSPDPAGTPHYSGNWVDRLPRKPGR